jgi:hypothetical protein
MTVYPLAIDSDLELPVVDDNITEIGGQAINSLRDAVFAIEETLGVSINGSVGDLATRLNESLNSDGTIKASALTSVGLATLPITNNQIGSSAGIDEYKLNLDYSTSDLHTLIIASSALLSSLNTFTITIDSNFTLHLTGAQFLNDGSTKSRHVLSQIDLNNVPSDSRDLSFSWSGLIDKNGNVRSSITAAQALLEINDDLVSHENSISGAHVSTAISVDVSDFNEIPQSANTVQKALDYLDDAEVLNLGQHRATQHSNGIPKISRSQSQILPDGYRENVVPATSAITYLVHNPNTTPVDDLSIGDNVIKFVPDNSNFIFDSYFSKVKIGDVARINYGNGIEVSFPIESIRYIPNTEWIIRINGINLFDSSTSLVRIDRSLYDSETYGVLAIAAANARDSSAPIYTNILSSVIVGHPRGAVALGLGFDSNQLNSSHYKLYLELYPSGNPSEKTISLPFIDVTGNLGATPGAYTVDSIVQTTNDKFREIGYNYRFIAFSYNGEFGIMLADAINNASFAIINGSNSSGTLLTSSFTDNVIGGNSLDTFDALGFGSLGSDVASPSYQGSWIDETAAQIPTKVLTPLKQRFAVVNGQKIDTFLPTYMANEDGYWDGYISARTPIGITNIEVTYTVQLDLKASGLEPGKTLVIQPTLSFSDPAYLDVDYGRFIIKSVNFIDACGSVGASTEITVINGLHAFGSGFGFSSSPALPVKIYFSEDSVSFDNQNLIDSGVSSTDYSRLHEIFINDEGKTFSHERARLPRQSETVSLLETENWHIVSISPKLRGYREADPLLFNKYLRFYILSYDSTTGEYDGYIGQKVPASDSIINTGPVSSGRKNVVTRFYDETGVDFIDLIFNENNVYPGINILSTNVPRYVDLELFASLQLNDELFCLGTCEVNWDPVSGFNIIQYVKNLRQFGSVSEDDLTNSALDFISAGDKYLHQNGVFRGLDYASTGSNGEVFFKGGMAVVNGKIISVNNSSVTIPQISNVTSGLPQDITWAVCLNEFGNLVPILLTTSKTQFFATTGSGSYYVPSVTFNELSNTRFDLTIIATVVATIASITISSVTDARKFIVKQDQVAPLVLSSNNKTIGNFYNLESLKNWVSLSDGQKSSEVKVRGDFTLTSSYYDLTGFTKPIIFDGSEATFNVSNDQGIIIGSFVTLKGFTFNFSAAGTPSSATALISDGGGCIFSSGLDLESITIENCKFVGTLTSNQRLPFIFFEMDNEQVNKNIRIINNIFEDLAPSSNLGKSQAAIVFRANTASSGSGIPSILMDCDIVRNICSHQQGIYVTTIKDSVDGAKSPGINAFNVNIKNNECGIIGVLTSSVENSSSILSDLNKSSGVTVSGNFCHIIASAYGSGEFIVDAGDLNYGTGHLQIIENKCHWVVLQIQDLASSFQYSHTIIKGNSFIGFDSTYLSLFSPTINNYGISVFNYSDTDTSEITIDSNSFGFGRYSSTTYGYSKAIWCSCAANITNNTIRGLNAVGANPTHGIYASNDAGGNSVKRFNITNNKIYRGANSITNYIHLPSTNSATHEGLVTNNYFDSYTIDGSSVATINNVPNNWVVNHNKNQTLVINVPGFHGSHAIDYKLITEPTSTLTSHVDVALGTASFPLNFYYNDTGVGLTFGWMINLRSLLPNNVKLITASFTYQATAQDGGDTITIFHSDSSGTNVTSTANITNITSNTITEDLSSAGNIKDGDGADFNIPYILIIASVNNASALLISVNDLQLTYRF